MALVIESIDAAGIITRAPVEPGTPLEISAEPGTRYRVVDDQGRAVGAGPKVVRQGDDLAIENFADGEVIVLKNFFTACADDNKCVLSTEEMGGDFEGLITPDSEPVAALAEGGYLMFAGEENRSAALPVEPGSEFNWKPIAAIAGALVVVAGAAGGGGGGGDVGSDTTPPADPTITTTSISSTSMVITGTAEANSEVTVVIDVGGDGTRDALYTTTANASGVWAVDLASETPTDGALPAGTLPASTATVQATDAAGNTSGSVTGQLSVGPNAPTIAVVEDDDVVNTAEAASGVEVSGTSDPDTTVTVTWGSAVQTVTTGADGTWTATFAGATVPADGASEISVVATNVDGIASDAITRDVTVDQTAPALTIASSAPGVSNEAVTFTFDFGEAVTGFDLSDITVANGNAGAFTAVSASEYTLVVEPNANVEATTQISVAADAALDVNGNGNAAASATNDFDTESPTLVITDNAAGSAAGPVTFTFTFSEPVTGFTAADIVVAGGTKGTFAGSGATYTLVVAPTGAAGTIDVSVAADAALDASGNGSTAATSSQVIDTVAPVLTITDNAAGTATGPVTFTFTFSEPVTGFTAADIVVAGGTKGTFAGSGNTYTMVVAPAGNGGTIDVSVAANAALDAAGNGSTAAQATQDFDAANPTVAITNNVAAGDTATGPVVYTFTFSEPVTGFAANDITVVNGAKGAFVAVTPGRVYRLTVTPDANEQGDIEVSTRANAAADAAGNSTALTQAADQSFDTLDPTLVITASSANDAGPITYTFTFSEPVTGFAAADIAVASTGEPPTRGAVVQVNPRVYRMVVTPADDDSGSITVAVAANRFADLNGNTNAVVSTAPAQAYDTIELPEVTITDNIAAGDTANGPVIYTFTWSEPVTGFTAADIPNATIANGARSGPLVTVTPGRVYQLEVTPDANTDANMTVTVRNNAVLDANGNRSNATTSDPVSVDTIDPDLEITSDATGTDADAEFVLTFDFGEEVSGFTLADITVAAGAGTAPTLGPLLTTDDIVYTVEVTPEPNETGNITFSVVAGAATDLAGNDSEAEVLVQGYDTSNFGGIGNNFAMNDLNNTV